MEKDFKKYDAICAEAANWLIWNKQQHSNNHLCITNVNSFDSEDLWLLTIANSVSSLLSDNIYISIDIIDFLYLRFIKKFKSLRLSFSKKDKYFINGIIFKDEIAKTFNETNDIFIKIYNEYYRR